MFKFLQNIFIFLFVSIISIYAQEYKINSERIDLRKELPDIITQSIHQDKDGFLWVVSSKYLSKYDGVNFTNYSKNSLNINISDRLIIALDANNKIWYHNDVAVGEHLKLQILDVKNNNIEEFDSLFKNAPFKNFEIIPPIRYNDKYEIFITVKNKGLYKYNGNSFKKIFSFKRNISPIKYFFYKNNDWFIVKDILYKINTKSLHKTKYKAPYPVIYMDDYNGLPIFITYDIDANKYKIYTLRDNKFFQIFSKLNFLPYDLFYTNIYHKDLLGNSWLRLDDKYLYINRKGEELASLKYDRLENKTFKLEKSFIDNHNNFWVTGNNGLHKITAFKNNFTNYLKGNSVRAIFKRGDSIFINTPTGIKMINLLSHKISSNLTPLKHTMASLYYRDTLWQTSINSVLEYHFIDKSFTIYKPKTNNIAYFTSIKKHPTTNSLFVGSKFGLHKVDTISKKIFPFIIKDNKYSILNNISINCIIIIKNNLLIGTSKGLFLMNNNEKIKNLILPNEFILDVLVDGSFYWIATSEGGLIKWDTINHIINRYTKKDGISDNTIYCIIKDDFGFLWLPTNKGLNRFAPKTNNNSIFLPRNGIPHIEFNNMSNYIDSKKNVYLGGLSGVTIFNPLDFLEMDAHKFPSDIIINEVIVLNQKSKNLIHKNTEVLINDTLTINKNNKYTEIVFTLMDFSNKKPLNYKYKIKGYKDEYIALKNNSIILSGLTKGEYDLYIKAQSANGHWIEKKAPIHILVKQSIFEVGYIKALFYTFLLLSLLGLIIVRRKIENKNIKENNIEVTNNEKEESQIENIISKEWLDKLDFIVLNNLSSNTFSVGFLAKELNLSERQLQRRLEKHKLLTPNKYITEIRLEEAFRLIKAKEIASVKALSIRVGFSSPDYFTKLFKKKYGIAPFKLIKSI